jgi:pyruvate, water dikinase
MTNPDWVPAMRRAAALVTDGGGMTCHAAIVSRELGVPCVVGARTPPPCCATGGGHRRRRRGSSVAGAVAPPSRRVVTRRAGGPAGARPSVREPLATRLYVNLAIAEHAEEVAALPVDGVGLLRAEFMVTDALGGEHPSTCSPSGGATSSSTACASRCSRITRAFAPRPVVYRTIDFRTNEFRGLAGRRPAYEPVEENPMIGYRGCYRYVREPDLFALELEVLARVREQTPTCT